MIQLIFWYNSMLNRETFCRKGCFTYMYGETEFHTVWRYKMCNSCTSVVPNTSAWQKQERIKTTKEMMTNREERT